MNINLQFNRNPFQNGGHGAKNTSPSWFRFCIITSLKQGIRALKFLIFDFDVFYIFLTVFMIMPSFSFKLLDLSKTNR